MVMAYNDVKRPHKLMFNRDTHYQHYQKMVEWAEEHFEKGSWTASATFGYPLFRFKNAKDAAWFALRW